MGNPTGAVLVILLGLMALGAAIILGVLLYRLDRRERGAAAHPDVRHAGMSYDDRRRRAA